MIIKPCKQSEIDFYESTAAHLDILPFIPTYMGRLSLGADSAQAAGALILPGSGATEQDGQSRPGTATLPFVDYAWAPSNGGKIQTDLAVVLENVAAGYKRPNILDVKLGARLWADDAPKEKKARLQRAAEETTSKSLGFRIAGMKTYQGSGAAKRMDVNSDGYRVFDKKYGRSFNAETVQQGFRDFFQLEKGVASKDKKDPIRKTIKRFLGSLEEMVQVLEKEESRMYSASLLFVYEGDVEAREAAFPEERRILEEIKSARNQQSTLGNNAQVDHGPALDEDDGAEYDSEGEIARLPCIQSVKLIDFAHAQWVPGSGPDENILHGIRNVIQLMRGLIG